MDTKLGVQHALENLRSVSALRDLFADTLNYRVEDTPLITAGWSSQRAAEPLREGRIIASHDDFRVVYCQIPKLQLTWQRAIVNQVLRHVSPYALVAFADEKNQHWHFVNVKYDEEAEKRRVFRRISVGPHERLHTAAERVAKLEIADESVSALAVQGMHDEAFDVQPVTREFYDKYHELFFWTVDVIRGKHDFREAHAFTQQLFNRLMFLYFVQKLYWEDDGERRYWLNNDPFYLSNLFQRYRTSGSQDEFLSLWLDGLFFQAFCKRYGFQTTNLPQDVKNEYGTMPWLNGGLFQSNKWDRQGFTVPDAVFERLYKELLEHFNFTVREDTPVDVEVAVDPVMLGHVYESLILEEERGRGGIFYTEATELDFMCRLALMEYLKGQVPLRDDEVIRLVVDVVTPDELPEYEPGTLAAVRDTLLEVKVVDPACGSGAFLVTMMNVMAQLHRFISSRTGEPVNLFELKKRIIADSLYGVDIKEWACRVAELRLWLSLIVETEGRYMDNMYLEPLLPNLDYKIRQGDSLVEEIEGQSLSLRGKFAARSTRLAKTVNQFIRRKDDYYYNRGDRAATANELRRLEMQILWDSIDSKLEVVNQALGALERSAAAEFASQLSFLGEGPEQPGLFDEGEQARKQRQRRREELGEDKERLLQARTAIGRKEERDYFLWDIDFAEVFQEKGGFDIVIGNPPYVRHQAIAPQNLLPREITPDIKSQYKDQLVRSVQTLWGNELNIDRRSDLYIYFYLHGLGLLRSGGVFCFITSNSWLDATYGAGLQQLLLERMKVKGIYDNLAKRSFSQSDINTVISIFQRPERAEDVGEHLVKFVAFRKPFEELVPLTDLAAIGKAQSHGANDDFRLRAVTQRRLRVEGSQKVLAGKEMRQPAPGPLVKIDKYIGDKWGGKYLRAPDIFQVVLDKGARILVEVDAIMQIETYLILPRKADQVLVLDANKVPAQLSSYFKPFIRSPRYFDAPLADLARHEVLVCTTEDVATDGDLRAFVTDAAARLAAEFKAPPVRPDWYVVGQEPAEILWQRRHSDRHLVLFNPHGFLSYDFYRLRYREASRTPIHHLGVAAFLSTVGWLFKEVYGRTSLGQGALKTEGTDIGRMYTIVGEELLAADEIVRHLLHRRTEPVRKEMSQPDRRALDNVLFDILGLSAGEREAVYEGVIELVESRMRKADSV